MDGRMDGRTDGYIPVLDPDVPTGTPIHVVAAGVVTDNKARRVARIRQLHHPSRGRCPAARVPRCTGCCRSCWRCCCCCCCRRRNVVLVVVRILAMNKTMSSYSWTVCTLSDDVQTSTDRLCVYSFLIYVYERSPGNMLVLRRKRSSVLGCKSNNK